MGIQIKKIHHLIRYFFIFGILAFVGYIKRWQDESFMAIMGPPLYLTYAFKNLINGYVSLPETANVNTFGFLLPVTLIYFSVIGFQLKQLWNERGSIRFVSLGALILFLLYMHYIAWKNLSLYFIPAGPI